MEKRKVQFNVRINSAVKDLVHLIAEADRMTVAEVIEETLKSALIPRAEDAEKILEIRRQSQLGEL